MINIEAEPNLMRYDLAEDSLVSAALANRMELLDVELQLARDAINIDVARNRQLPYIAMEFEYGVIGRQGSFGTAWQDMWDFDKSEVSIGLRGEIPVTNNAREARLREAMIKRAQRLSVRDQQQLAIR